jgi:hypothetical protein
MNDEVEIFGMTDPPHVPNRSVWYFVEHHGQRSANTQRHAEAEVWAKAIADEHQVFVIDRSDRGNGYLLSTLGR